MYLLQWLETKEGVATPTDAPIGLQFAASSMEASKPADKPAVQPSDSANSGIPAAQQAQNERVNLTFVGDIMFSGNVDDLLVKQGYEYPFKYVKSYLEKADIAVANLETPITSRGTAQDKEYVYRSSPSALPELKRAGIDLVNIANNHTMDYGVEGLLDTLDALDGQELLRVGGGRTADEAYKHVIVEKKGIKIAFLGFSRVLPTASWEATAKKAGLASTYSSKLPLSAIAKARAEADLVIVIAHWGEERNPRPVQYQTDLAHEYIDAGADLVVASHPHVLQGFEQYNGKWIAYSLGNFIFTTNDIPETWESMILEASCTKDRNCELSMLPILTKGAQPIRMVEDQGQNLFEKLTRNSINAKIAANGVITVGPFQKLLPPPVPAKQAEPKGSSGAIQGAAKPAATNKTNAATPAQEQKPKVNKDTKTQTPSKTEASDKTSKTTNP